MRSEKKKLRKNRIECPLSTIHLLTNKKTNLSSGPPAGSQSHQMKTSWICLTTLGTTTPPRCTGWRASTEELVKWFLATRPLRTTLFNHRTTFFSLRTTFLNHSRTRKKAVLLTPLKFSTIILFLARVTYSSSSFKIRKNRRPESKS